MMAQAKITPPIDRPLSRAYLREFGGWSTAFPPGTSEPSTLRTMHNCSVDHDGSLRIRPGMRRILNTPNAGDIVGDIEHFYTANGRKAILYGVRDVANGNRVVFRAAIWSEVNKWYARETDMTVLFPGFTDFAMSFNSSTTYITY